jgi:hypothetical protein
LNVQKRRIYDITNVLEGKYLFCHQISAHFVLTHPQQIPRYPQKIQYYLQRKKS